MPTSLDASPSTTTSAGQHHPAASSNGTSPRRRPPRPLPFTAANPTPPPPLPPPAPPVFDYPSNAHYDDSGYSTAGPSRPPSPSFFRSSVAEVHAVLYAKAGRNRDEIREFVRDVYDTNAVFENPVTNAKGPEQIADLFGLMGLVPGDIWSELGEVCESSQSYDGTRMIVMSHTLHVSFLSFLNPHPPLPTSASRPTLHRSTSYYSSWSVPSTPYPTTVPAPTTAVDPGLLSSTTVPAAVATASSGRYRWPLRTVLGYLAPTSVARSLTTVHLKLHSRLVFNELGKVILHEDVVGFKEAIEGLVPLVGTLYELNRKGIGFLASTASRVLLGKGRAASDEEQGAARYHENFDGGGLGMLGLPPGAGVSGSGHGGHGGHHSHHHSSAYPSAYPSPYPSAYPHTQHGAPHHHHSSHRLGSPVALRKMGMGFSVSELEERLSDHGGERATTSVDLDES